MKKLVSLRNKKGFTLVELIIVIAIVAVLAAVVAPQYIKYVDKSKIAADINNLSAVESAINVLCADTSLATAVADDETITYAADGELTGTHAEDVMKLVGGSKSGTKCMTKPLTSSKNTASIVFTVNLDGDGTPTITLSDDFHAWN